MINVNFLEMFLKFSGCNSQIRFNEFSKLILRLLFCEILKLGISFFKVCGFLDKCFSKFHIVLFVILNHTSFLN